MALHSKTGEISGKKLHDEVLQGDPRQGDAAERKRGKCRKCRHPNAENAENAADWL